MTIAFFDTKPYDKPSFTRYGKERGVTFKFYETKLNPDTAALAKGCDGVCAFVNDDLSKATLEALLHQNIKLIAMRCAGYNNVDLKFLKGKLPLFHVPAYSPYAIAEHTMAMLLTSIRRIHKAYIRTRDFNFSLNNLIGFDLHGKTVGIIGTGRIGSCFAEICNGFGMRVLAYDKYPKEQAPFSYVPLDTLLAESDIVSLHCPLTRETYHMIDEIAIRKMKASALLVNTSRGALVDTEVLLTAIKERRIGGACLDVYEEESDLFFEDFSGHIINDDTLARLISMPNVIVTSHQAFLTEEALDNIAETTVSNIVGFLQAGKLDNAVQ